MYDTPSAYYAISTTTRRIHTCVPNFAVSIEFDFLNFFVLGEKRSARSSSKALLVYGGVCVCVCARIIVSETNRQMTKRMISNETFLNATNPTAESVLIIINHQHTQHSHTHRKFQEEERFFAVDFQNFDFLRIEKEMSTSFLWKQYERSNPLASQIVRFISFFQIFMF